MVFRPLSGGERKMKKEKSYSIFGFADNLVANTFVLGIFGILSAFRVYGLFHMAPKSRLTCTISNIHAS